MSREQRFQIFRSADAPLLEHTDVQPLASEITPVEAEGYQQMAAAGFAEGQEVQVLVNIPGFSLLHIWSKKGYPLPLHTHNADCLYYVVSGSVTIGTECLGPRDSFFIPADMPYTYRVGPEGAEVLEIRQARQWDLKLLSKTPAYFENAVNAIAANIQDWKRAKRPALNC